MFPSIAFLSQAPRYTSYPPVPAWNIEQFSEAAFLDRLRRAHRMHYAANGSIALYIHLPYCESLCYYCGCNTIITSQHHGELPYIELVLMEWQRYRQWLGINPIVGSLHLGGGTPTFFQPEHLSYLINSLGLHLHKDAELSFEAHPAHTSEAHLKTLHAMGFNRLSLGIQDFNPEVQQLINRKQTYAQVESHVAIARQLGYNSINFDLVYGLPAQTPDRLQSSIEKAVALKPDRFAFYAYAHMPALKPAQKLIPEHKLPSKEERSNLYALGRATFLAHGYQEIGMDHFALPQDVLCKASQKGTLHRNFMGYTNVNTPLLIGLGVSSISDAQEGFAQNHKTLKAYQNSLLSGSLPIAKGHLHTAEDKELQRHILEIICHMHTQWTKDSPVLNTISKAISHWQAMQADGLVNLGNGQLHVNESGRPYLRQICAVLDPSFQSAPQLAQQAYSAT